MSQLPFPVKFARRWKISISSQLLPSGSSTKSASAFSFHHQAGSNKISKISESAHPSGPWTAPRDPDSHYQQQISLSFQFPPPGSSTKSASASSLHHQAAAPNQHQLPNFPPPGSSTKSASTSSFYHQATAPHQPAPSKATSQPAVNSTSLPHPHHGSQVCCCLDILWLFLYFSLNYLHRDKVG